MRRLRLLATLCAAAVALTAPAAAGADPGAGEVGLIVVRDTGLSAAERTDVRRDAGVELDRLMRLPDAEVVTVDRDDAGVALRELNADPDVRYAVRDMKVSAATNDPGWPDQWGLHNTGWNSGVADADMDVPEAWLRDTGTGVTVAVVDTGVDLAHADLAGKLDTARDKDWIQNDTTAQDLDGHGTHVAGTIAATSENALGVAGVAPGSTILPLRVLDENGDGVFSDIADAFDYAGDLGIDVVNASLGGEGYGSYYPIMDAVLTAHPNTVYVVAAGNEGMDLGSTSGTLGQYWSFPCESGAGGGDDNLVCVGASTASETRASFSNYGNEEVDVFAPGHQILATELGGTDVFMSGTSMATPMASATAALLVGIDPGLTGTQLKQLLMAGDAKPAYATTSTSGKRVNADLATASLGTDADGDGVSVPGDNCPGVANPGQADADLDGTGDACDATPNGSDGDGDGVTSGDNCPTVYNPDQTDSDGDGKGNACDSTPNGITGGSGPSPSPSPDSDGDGVADSSDDCPFAAGPASNDGCPIAAVELDSDADGMPDRIDRCPTEPGPGQNHGCPLPPTAPRVTTLKARAARRIVSVTAAADRPARLALRVERRVCKRRKCRWALVRRHPVRDVGTTALTFKLSGRHAKGQHRLIATVSASGVDSVQKIAKLTVR